MNTTTAQQQVIDSRNFTFGDWVAVCDDNVETAISEIHRLFSICTFRYLIELDQDHLPESDMIWDGDFTFKGGNAWYVGTAHPSNGGGTAERIVNAADKMCMV